MRPLPFHTTATSTRSTHMKFFDQKSSIAGERIYRVGLTGTGAADATKRWGQGVTVTRQSAGVHRITFLENPGNFQGWGQDVGATTPSAVKNYSVVRGDYTVSGSTYYIDVSIFNAAGTATDLAAAQYLDLEFRFATSGAAS
jgi:hypothetical protein